MFSVTCGKCAATYSLRPDDLHELSRVEQMICVKEDLDFTNMVKVTCTRCGTSALVPRDRLVPIPDPGAEVDGPPTPVSFLSLADETRTILRGAFENPGPLYSQDRKSIVTGWLENFAGNLEAAAAAFRTGLDVNGRLMTRSQLAASVEHMCREYQKGVTRLEEVCGHHVRRRFEQILARTRAGAGELHSSPTPDVKVTGGKGAGGQSGETAILEETVGAPVSQSLSTSRTKIIESYREAMVQARSATLEGLLAVWKKIQELHESVKKEAGPVEADVIGLVGPALTKLIGEAMANPIATQISPRTEYRSFSKIRKSFAAVLGSGLEALGGTLPKPRPSSKWFMWSFVPWLNWAAWVHAAIRTRRPVYLLLAIPYAAPFLAGLALNDPERFAGLAVASWIAGIVHTQLRRDKIAMAIAGVREFKTPPPALPTDSRSERLRWRLVALGAGLAPLGLTSVWGALREDTSAPLSDGEAFTVLTLCFIPLAFGAWAAARLGRDARIWGLGGVFSAGLCYLVLAFLPERSE